MSPIQQMLYEDFSKSEIQKDTINAIKSQSCSSFSMFQVGTSVLDLLTYSIFFELLNYFFDAVFFSQALRYLQSVCNHPKLVLTPEHPLCDEITRQLESENSSLSDIKHAAKLIALK